MDFSIADRSMAVMKKSLDLRARRQQVIASNIANAETPGYEARRLSFEDDLQKAISSSQQEIRATQPKHFPGGGVRIEDVQGTISKVRDTNPLGDDNTVSVEDEMLELAENQLLYEAGTQMLKKKIGMIKYVVAGGR